MKIGVHVQLASTSFPVWFASGQLVSQRRRMLLRGRVKKMLGATVWVTWNDPLVRGSFAAEKDLKPCRS